MGINALTVRQIVKARKETEVMKKEIMLPVYYEVYSGIMNYRTGAWVRMDPVDSFRTLASAREELKFRFRHPSDNQNAAYIIRRYRHGKQNITETVEALH